MPYPETLLVARMTNGSYLLMAYPKFSGAGACDCATVCW